jgi:hypothetical protein
MGPPPQHTSLVAIGVPGRHYLGARSVREPLHWGVATAVRYGRRDRLRFCQEQRPQLLWVQRLLMAGSTGADHSDSHLVYWAEQVVCRPVNHS